MRDHTNCKRGFHHTGGAWYGSTVLPLDGAIDRITMGFYHPQGGTSGEFSVIWETLAGRATPKLVAYNDSFSALHHFADVLKKLSGHDSENISPIDLCDLLTACGIEDMTQRVHP